MRLERLTGPRAPLGLLFGLAGAAVLALAAAWLRLGLPLPACALRAHAGIPCPTCGTTRLVEALLAGRLVEAFAWNPLVLAAAALLAGWALGSLAFLVARRPGLGLRLAPVEARALRVGVVAAVLANWAWLIARGA